MRSRALRWWDHPASMWRSSGTGLRVRATAASFEPAAAMRFRPHAANWLCATPRPQGSRMHGEHEQSSWFSQARAWCEADPDPETAASMRSLIEAKDELALAGC